MSAFVGSSLATLFPDSVVLIERNEPTSVSGTQIERDLMDLMNDSEENPSDSPASFIDSEIEEGNLFPWTEDRNTERNTNQYGRPSARVLPTMRENRDQEGILPTPTVSQAPNYELGPTNAQNTYINEPMDQGVRSDVVPSQELTPGNTQGFNLSPMLFPIPMSEMTQETPQAPLRTQPPMQLGSLFNVVHSPNVLLIPAQERQSIRLLPTIMPNVAG